MKRTTCYLYKCEPKKYKYRYRFMKHKIGDACVKIVTVKSCGVKNWSDDSEPKGMIALY